MEVELAVLGHTSGARARGDWKLCLPAMWPTYQLNTNSGTNKKNLIPPKLAGSAVGKLHDNYCYRRFKCRSPTIIARKSLFFVMPAHFQKQLLLLKGALQRAHDLICLSGIPPK